MAWVLLIVAGVFETVFAVSLKLSHGFTRLVPSIVFCASGLASFALLTIALKKLPVGTAYAVWTGIGAAGTATYGIVYMNEVASTMRIVSIALIVAGVVGLNLAGLNH